MTLALAAITHDYVLLAADRMVTVATGPRRGDTIQDDRCKIVNLCNLAAIAYTGLADLEGRPTHEWIACELATNNCQDPGVAGELLRVAGERALRRSVHLLPQEFLIAGWGLLAHTRTLNPHFRIVSNIRADDGAILPAPTTHFSHGWLSLSPDAPLGVYGVGQPPAPGRPKLLDRRLRQMLRRGVSPKYAMRALVYEIVNASASHRTVGEKIICCCIPRVAAQTAIDTGEMSMLAVEPNLQSAAFCSFDPHYSQLKQYGPTFACGNSALTDVKTEDDPEANRQRSSVRILRPAENIRSDPRMRLTNGLSEA